MAGIVSGVMPVLPRLQHWEMRGPAKNLPCEHQTTEETIACANGFADNDWLGE